MKKYLRIPQPVEAIQYNGHNDTELRRWSEGNVIGSPVLEPTEDNPTGRYVQIIGGLIGRVGDYIIKDYGNYYAMREKQFLKEFVVAL